MAKRLKEGMASGLDGLCSRVELHKVECIWPPGSCAVLPSPPISGASHRGGLNEIFYYSLFFPNPVGGDKPPSFFFLKLLALQPWFWLCCGTRPLGVIATIQTKETLWGSIKHPQGTNRRSSSPQRDFPRALLTMFIPGAANSDTKFMLVIKGLWFCSQNKDTSSC